MWAKREICWCYNDVIFFYVCIYAISSRSESRGSFEVKTYFDQMFVLYFKEVTFRLFTSSSLKSIGKIPKRTKHVINRKLMLTIALYNCDKKYQNTLTKFKQFITFFSVFTSLMYTFFLCTKKSRTSFLWKNEYYNELGSELYSNSIDYFCY